jgi:hypothetical protein
MTWAGVVVTILGFLITLSSLGLATGTGARMAIVIAGIAISLFGIIGLINKAAISNAIWQKERR